MNGGKVRYFFIVILPLFAAACTPLGHVFDSDSSFSGDEIMVIPRRHEYKAGEYFLPKEDLYVYIANEEGAVKSVPLSQVSIGIVTNPDSTTPNDPVPISASGAQLVAAMGTGRKLITVKYSGLDPATYSIEVRDVLGGTGGDGTGDGSGFYVIWQ